MNYWIQEHDYSSSEVNGANLNDVVAKFNSFDWELELNSYEANNNERNCPAGIGINLHGCLLHICPIDKDLFFFNFHHRYKEKPLGLFSSSKEDIHYVAEFPSSKFKLLVGLFEAKKFNDILAIN